MSRTIEKWKSPDGKVRILKHETFLPSPTPQFSLEYKGVQVMGNCKFQAASKYFWDEFAHAEEAEEVDIDVETRKGREVDNE